jgi:hypothetical protein
MMRKSFLKFGLIALIAFFFITPKSSFAQDDESGFTIGGAVRYNFVSENYESDPTATSTYFTWDTWRINVDGSVANVDLSFEYRFYPTFGSHFIHHGYLGYAFSDDVYMELGATQVPFGITTYASHSWWFQGPYYVGLEDDYDMGVNFDITPSEKLKLSLSYFRQAEPEGPIYGGDVTFGNAGAGRYSYDITTGNNYYNEDNTAAFKESIRELNQFNARLAYDVSDSWQFGISAQVGGIYNDYLGEAETSTAFAGHVVGNFGNFNLKAEYVKYNYAAKGARVELDQDGNETDNVTTYDLETVQMGAYGFNYPVAAEASMYVAGLAYTIPVEWGPISSIQPYVDYTLIDKTNEDFYDTHHLVPGMLITAGSIYTYVDYAMGKNQPWLTDDFGKGLGVGVEDAEWLTRFNINIGYYF